MKVGTDGVLLGALAQGGKRILDIGTGSGLVALLMAQRFPEAMIIGIDIDEDACNQAKENVSTSPFSQRIEIVNKSLEEYSSSMNGGMFDSIVCNPPFFENSLKCPDEQRTNARHTSSLPLSSLIGCAKRLLTDDGALTIIVPTDLLTRIEEECAYESMFIVEKLNIKTVARKQPKRTVLTIMKSRKPCLISIQLLMENGNRSTWYQNITQDFYL